MDIDYNLLRTLPQEQAMAYLRERFSASPVGAISNTSYSPMDGSAQEGGTYYAPAQYTAPGGGVYQPAWSNNGRMDEAGYMAYDADPAPENRIYTRQLTPSFDPAYDGGTYGHYEGVYDANGNLINTQFKQDERHHGWWDENFDWAAPAVFALLSGGAASGMMGAGEAAGAGAGAAAEGAVGSEALIGGTAGDMLGGESLYSLAQPGSSLPQGLGTGTFGMNAAYTTPGLAALESGTLPALTQTGASVLGSTLPSASAIAAATPGLIPAAAPSFLEKLISKAGDKLLDKATDPVTLASLALAATGSGGGGTPTGTSGGTAMSPEQQAYYNRPTQSWDWDRLRQEAEAAGLSLPQYIARNWNTVSGGAFNRPVKMYAGGYARGGEPGLGQVARLMRGGGSGRADTIPARLSDGEYVMDAETVAMLGDGSTDEGARRLDSMRQQVRAHKGRALSRGKISPDAKSPLAYMKGRK